VGYLGEYVGKGRGGFNFFVGGGTAENSQWLVVVRLEEFVD
jgi:hypothetical protein